MLDGQTHPVEDKSQLWLPRFREQQTGDGRRTVAPVCVAARLEDGEYAPAACALVVTQRVVDDGRVVMDEEVARRISESTAVSTSQHEQLEDEVSCLRMEVTRVRATLDSRNVEMASLRRAKGVAESKLKKRVGTWKADSA